MPIDVTAAEASGLVVRVRDWGFEVWSTQNIDLATWQPYADAAMFRVCAELAEWAERLPAGLVRLDPSVRAAPPRRTVSTR